MPTQEMPMHYINREEWGADPALSELPDIEHPVKYIRLTFTKDFKRCKTNKKCTKRVKELQQHDFKLLNLPDMQPNFFVAGDGFVYEGRGWRKQPPGMFERPDLDGKFLEICYIGDYSLKPPTVEMLYRSKQVMQLGVDNDFLDKDFEILELGGPTYTDLGAKEPRF